MLFLKSTPCLWKPGRSLHIVGALRLPASHAQCVRVCMRVSARRVYPPGVHRVCCRRSRGSVTCSWSTLRSSGRCLPSTWTRCWSRSPSTRGTASPSSSCSTTTWESTVSCAANGGGWGRVGAGGGGWGRVWAGGGVWGRMVEMGQYRTNRSIP